ncbi:MAG: AraC-like DNA-binding protein [Paraglaciecola sp.]|jgi:AraC-like DNA-binding protein
MDTIKDTSLQHTTIASWLLAISQTLNKLGIDSQQVLNKFNVDLMQIKTNPDQRISVVTMTAIWDYIETISGRPDIGFLVAKHCQPQSFRSLGFSLIASDTIQDCLTRIENYAISISSSVNVVLQHEQQGTAICISPKLDVEVSYLAMDAFILSIHKLFKQLLNDNLHTQIEFTSPRRKHNEKLYFEQCEIKYNSDKYRYWLPKDVLNIPLTLSDKHIAQLSDQKLEKYIECELSQQSTSTWLFEVKRCIRLQTIKGEVAAPTIAKMLHISERSLRRKLAENNLTYSLLLEEAKKHFAESWLQEGKSITEIAYLLGYQDSSNFTRAFKNWFKLSPRQYKKKKNHASSTHDVV